LFQFLQVHGTTIGSLEKHLEKHGDLEILKRYGYEEPSRSSFLLNPGARKIENQRRVMRAIFAYHSEYTDARTTMGPLTAETVKAINDAQDESERVAAWVEGAEAGAHTSAIGGATEAVASQFTDDPKKLIAARRVGSLAGDVLVTTTPVAAQKLGAARDAAAQKRAAQPRETDLSHLDKATGPKRAEIDQREKMIDSIMSNELQGLRLTFRPRYNPDLSPSYTGISREGAGIQLGPAAFRSRFELAKTTVHEELHHRWWKRGIRGDHHPVFTLRAQRFYGTVNRYLKLRGIHE
jgi:hypothetical protein